MIESLLRDARYGARLLRQAPLFTVVTVASIAFGLGGGLAIFTVANAMILRPIVAGGEDILRIYTAARDGSRFGGSSYADYRDFAQARAFSGSCATDDVRANVTIGTASAGRAGAVVSAGCFGLLGLRAHVGRFMTAPDASEIVISYALWKRE